MSDVNFDACANRAIRETVKEMRPSIDQSWMTLVPATPLTMPDRPEWMDFLGRIMKRYNRCVAQCSGPAAERLVDKQNEQLIALRDAIVEATKCP